MDIFSFESARRIGDRNVLRKVDALRGWSAIAPLLRRGLKRAVLGTQGHAPMVLFKCFQPGQWHGLKVRPAGAAIIDATLIESAARPNAYVEAPPQDRAEDEGPGTAPTSHGNRKIQTGKTTPHPRKERDRKTRPDGAFEPKTPIMQKSYVAFVIDTFANKIVGLGRSHALGLAARFAPRAASLIGRLGQAHFIVSFPSCRNRCLSSGSRFYSQSILARFGWAAACMCRMGCGAPRLV